MLEVTIAHDDAARPLRRGALLCDCERCGTALAESATDRPFLPVLVATVCGELLITTATRALQCYTDGGLDSLTCDPDDLVGFAIVGPDELDNVLRDAELDLMAQELSLSGAASRRRGHSRSRPRGRRGGAAPPAA